jgi:hypothetical protein
MHLVAESLQNGFEFGLGCVGGPGVDPVLDHLQVEKVFFIYLI